DIVLETLSDDFYDHDGPGGKPTDREGDRRMMIAMHERIPDLHLTIEDLIAEHDKVVCRNVWRGRATGGRRIEFNGNRNLRVPRRQDRRALGVSGAPVLNVLQS